MKTFQQIQLELTAYLRSPEQSPAPANVETRRLHIYRDLVYNNIENFIANVFPVTCSILGDNSWHKLVREFIQNHDCQTPYFVQISDEFVQYTLQVRGLRDGDPAYLLELIHYEWIELALDVSTDVIPDAGVFPTDVENSRPRVSPVAVCLTYQYPVHKVSAAFPHWQVEPTQLLVYRNRRDVVCFSAANLLTARLLFLLQSDDQPLNNHLETIAAELQYSDVTMLKKQAFILLEGLYRDSVISHFE
ncbi:HvfC family RiPP maturation protein [Cellvibrio mixtus]|uniref:HvfC family RiPP maturation protein n=1 Tax=Cellvibrio mixtus TaxID=39650 RepID=UPI000586C42B|nr:putative DNA-binding domain-containing protein [Cellvibrio mixtus]